MVSKTVTPAPKPAPVQPQPAEEPVEHVPMEVDQEWEDIKAKNQVENEQFNKTDFDTLNQKKELPLNQDGSLSIFWYDAHEEYGDHGVVYLFGKCYNDKTRKFSSVCVQVKELERIMYAVPKD